MSKKKGMADPVALKPFDAADKTLLRVIIETPKGSRNKFAFNEAERIFELKKVLPAGMGFPYDFGFVPSTRAAPLESSRGSRAPRKRRNAMTVSLQSKKTLTALPT
jgi:hypothetical protein